MNLYKMFLSKEGTKDFLKEVNNDTLAILKSFEKTDEYSPLSDEDTMNIVDNLNQIMESRKTSETVSFETALNFDMYKECAPIEKGKTL